MLDLLTEVENEPPIVALLFSPFFLLFLESITSLSSMTYTDREENRTSNRTPQILFSLVTCKSEDLNVIVHLQIIYMTYLTRVWCINR